MLLLYKLRMKTSEVQTLADTIWRIRDSYCVGRKKRNILKYSISENKKFHREIPS